ncbi:hypothetical protein BGW38_003357, partial [Lunasporangiospora selenospora]
LPGRSILKSTSQDESEDPATTQESSDNDHLPPSSSMENPSSSTNTADITETFGSAAESSKRNRKSFGRRVSFAATARIRMFEREEREEDFAKTTSFLEGGFNPRAILGRGFISDNSSDAGNNSGLDTGDTIDSTKDDTFDRISSGPRERTEGSIGSNSDSEKERSFEINVHAGNSPENSGTITNLNILRFTASSSSGRKVKTPFDDGDMDQGSSSEDEDGHYYPDVSLMKRSSGIGLIKGDRDSILGPQILLGNSQDQGSSLDAPRRIDEVFAADEADGFMGDEASMTSQDFHSVNDSINILIQRRRSSVQEAALAEPETLDQDLSQQHSTSNQITEGFGKGEFVASSGGSDRFGEMGSSQSQSQSQSHTSEQQQHGQETTLSQEHMASGSPSQGEPPSPTDDVLEQQDSSQSLRGLLPPQTIGYVDELDGAERFGGDEDTDMDITAPIGAGIHELAQEQPPLAFDQAADHTAVFSDLGTPMDMTQTIGAGILETNLELEPTTPLDSVENVLMLTTPSPQSDAVDPEPSIPTTPTRAPRRQSDVFDNDNEGDDGFMSQDHTADFTQSISQIPSTPPRRVSLLRGGNASPTMTPRRGLSTPGRFTPTVKERFNIFPEIMERQLQNMESALTTPDRLSNQREQLSMEIETLEYDIEDGRSQQEDLGDDDVTQDIDMLDAAEDEGDSVDEDSTEELPPITLKKFLHLVGISFLDNLVANTRRRTIPHHPGNDDASQTKYNIGDLVKATTLAMAEIDAYQNGSKIIKEYIDESRESIQTMERRMNKENPDFFRDFREGDSDYKEFIKDRFKLIKVHCKLDATQMWSIWRTDLYNFHQEILEYHHSKLSQDKTRLAGVASTLAPHRGTLASRHEELKRQLEQARERQSAFLQCDKDQLASLAEAIEEQGTQLEQFKLNLAKRKKEHAEILSKVDQLKLVEKSTKTRIVAAEKTIQEHQYVRPEDLARAQQLLGLIQSTHLWETHRPMTNSLKATKADPAVLEFVYDRSIKASIDVSKLGRDPKAIQVTEFEQGGAADEKNQALMTSSRQLVSISAFMPKKRRTISEYSGLLRDFTTLIASKYKIGTSISKVLSDIAQFWTKVNLIRREIELVRTRNVVNLVAGSEENLRELEEDGEGSSSPSKKVSKPKPGPNTPLVVLDIRLRFTRFGPRKSSNGEEGGENDEEDEVEPLKFYVWFTFTLNDILSFPARNSFTWRLELVYGDISHDEISKVIGPSLKQGGYTVLSDICTNINTLLGRR